MSRLYKGDCSKYTDENGRYTYVEYTNIEEYFKMIKDKPIARGRDNSSETGDSGWSGTSSLNEAINLMTKGDKESMKLLTKTKTVTDAMFKDVEVHKPKNVNSVEGHQPIVPHAIMGLPESMIKTERPPMNNKVVNVFINSSASSGTDKEEIAFHGAMLLSAVQQLENNGYRVGLYVGKIAYMAGGEDITGHIVNIKPPMAPLNLLKYSYYLINPSFLRRTCFRIDEVEDKIIDCTHDGYGQATNYSQIEDIVKGTFREQMLIYDSRVDINPNNTEEENVENIKEFFEGYLEK